MPEGREPSGPSTPTPASKAAAEAPSAAAAPSRKGPRRGSAAATQKRDGRGRFKPKRPARPRIAGGSRAGKRGSSHRWRKPHLWLVRKLVEVDHQVGRLEAEREGRVWSDPEPSRPANMAVIRKDQDERVRENQAALTDVLLDLAARRCDERHHVEIAEAMTAITGRFIHPRSLYRPPYDTMWREVDPDRIIGSHVADGAASFGGRSRLSKRMLVHLIEHQTARREALREERRAALLAQSLEEDWQPLPIRIPAVRGVKATGAADRPAAAGADAAAVANDDELVSAA